MTDSRLMNDLIALCVEAGRAILDVYATGDAGVSFKEDRSPLTRADRASHEIITRGLARIAPSIPVLSEEGREIEYATRRLWDEYFLVDPLDGTKEFINRNGEFTVNIALMKDNIPVAGVVHVPVRGSTYYAYHGGGAYKVDAPGAKAVRIRVAEAPAIGEGLMVVASRSHGSEALEGFLSALTVRDRVSAGSSLKFCLVAEGCADIYPRFGPTWEWDTAAGHAVVNEAGGCVTQTHDDDVIGYNKEIIKHEGFIVWGSVRREGLALYRA